MNQYKLNEPGEEFNLNVGDRLVVKDELLEGSEFTYGGMNSSNDRYIINLFERELFFKRNRGTLYFPKENKTLTITDIQIDVLDVNPSVMKVRYSE